MMEFLAKSIASGAIRLKKIGSTASFHDPCQVVRRGGLKEQPRDMNARKLSPGTQRNRIRACKRFAAFLKRSPDTAEPDDVGRFHLHLRVLRLWQVPVFSPSR